MKKLILIVPLLALPFLNGCTSIAGLAEQLKNDPATVDVNVTTIYGQMTFHRAFPTNWTQPVILTTPVTVSTNVVK